MPQGAGDVKGAGWAVTPGDLELLYTENPDPWDVTESWCERRKRELTVALLPKERYCRCYEPGCSIGELTKLLASRCDELLAVDCATVAVRRAREATVDLAHVRVEQAVTARSQPNWPGSDLHRLLRDRPQLLPLVHHEDEAFILDVLRRKESGQGR